MTTTRVFVAGLPYDMSETELQELALSHAKATDVRICFDQHTKQSRGFGFVDTTDEREAEKLIAALSGHRMGNRVLRAELANPRPSRDDSRSLYT